MGRLYVHLDPSGYSRLLEPGRSERWSGGQMMTVLQGTGASYKPQDSLFWAPEGGEWMLPKPKQFRPGWYADDELADSLIRRADWTFSSACSGIIEYARSRKSDGTSSWHWTSAYVASTGGTSLDGRDYGALTAAAGIDYGGTEILTVATCSQAPNGQEFDGSFDLHPWFGFVQLPAPDDVLAFGWANIAVLWAAGNWQVLRSPQNDGVEWELLAKGALEPGKQVQTGPLAFGYFTPSHASQRIFMACPVGPDKLWVSFERSGSKLIKMREGGSGVHLFPAGNWWVASPRNATVNFQAQVVAYEPAGTELLAIPKPLFFDLGLNYLPTQQPEFVAEVLMHTSGDITRSDANNEATYTVADGDETIILGVRDDAYTEWDSDGTRSKGTLRITMTPEGSRFPAYLAPQVRYLALRFPPVLTPRDNSELILDDTQWAALSVATSLRDVTGKRIMVAIHDSYADLLVAEGFDYREGYPIEVWEDTNDNGSGDTLRARGWVTRAGLDERRTADGTIKTAHQRYYLIEARGLLDRANEGWLHPPHIVAPDSEFVEHTFAIQEALRQAAFDVTDTSMFGVFADPWTGTDIARLPGSSGSIGDEQDLVNDGAYNPDWDEPKTRYMERIATEWRGWLLYENDTRILYHPDIAWGVFVGESYYRSGTIYRTRAEAAAADATRPRQRYLAGLERAVTRMPCNTIRISGKNPGESAADQNKSFHCLDRLAESIVDTTSEHFLGEERLHPRTVTPKLAVSMHALEQIARVKLLRLAKRKQEWTLDVHMAPWLMTGADGEVGRIWALQEKGDFLIAHCQWSVLGRGTGAGTTTTAAYEYRTRFGVERLPQRTNSGGSPTVSMFEGGYPGEGG